jgi:phosphoribosylformylglycinamidine synthase
MASKAGSGIEINLDLVPQREEGMTPYEIMLSESQERMLIVAHKEKVKEVQKTFAKWDLDAVIIGQVTKGGKLKVKAGGKGVVDLPVDTIVDLCPVYKRKSALPTHLKSAAQLEVPPLPQDFNQTFLRLLSSPTIADKEWVYRQYDHMVQINTAILPGADAALLRIKNIKKALAITLDGNSLYSFLDPQTGGKIAVAEACRNLSSVGARPLAVTNCLNFGNPEKPEIVWQFEKTIQGISQACQAFGIPVTGGNVSFYNDTEGISIFPSPVLGLVGAVEDSSTVVTPGFKANGHNLLLIGKNKEELGASEYLKWIFDSEKGIPPRIDLKEEKRVQEFCREAISQNLVQSSHDVSEGGLAVCLAECCFASPSKIGCRLSLQDHMRPDALLFAETQSRILVTVKDPHLKKFLDLAQRREVQVTILGKTGKDRIIIDHLNQRIVDIPVEKAFSVWKNAIPDRFKIR